MLAEQQKIDAASAQDQAQALGPPAKRSSTSTADEFARPAKIARNSSTASQQLQQQQHEVGTESEGAAPAPIADSPSGSDAAAAAASLHKLSSGTAVEMDSSLAAYTAAMAASEHVSPAAAAAAADPQQDLSAGGGLRRIGSGMSNVPLGSGGPLKSGQGKTSPQEIMEALVESGLLQSYSPETHCYVKCGNVQV